MLKTAKTLKKTGSGRKTSASGVSRRAGNGTLTILTLVRDGRLPSKGEPKLKCEAKTGQFYWEWGA